MPTLTRPSPAAFLAIIYITLGALIDVWTAIYYLFLRNPDGADSSRTLFWCAGFFFTGLVLLIIGLAVGRIGREARHAELPPPDANQPPQPQPVVMQQPMVPQAMVVAPPPAMPVAPTAVPATPTVPPVAPTVP